MSDLNSPGSYWINVYVNGTSSSFEYKAEADDTPLAKTRIGLIEVKLEHRKIKDVIYHKLDNTGCNPGHTTQIVNNLNRRINYFKQKRIR